jgi:hypothetical protein
MSDDTLFNAADQQRGNFIAGLNRAKTPGSREPDFTGTLEVPGAEQKHRFVLWAHRDKRDRPYFSGTVNGMPVTDDVMHQIAFLADQEANMNDEVVLAAPNLELKPQQMVLFTNSSKAPVTADTPDEAETRKRRPDFWGVVNIGDGTPPFRISAWATQDRYKNPVLSGSTSYPQPGRAREEDVTPEQVVASEAGRRSRRGKGDEGRAG